MGKIVLILILACSVYSQSDFHYFGHDYDRTPLGDAIDRASIQMLKEVYQTTNEKNVISSPLGVLILLSLYAKGAEGTVRDDIVKVLGTGSYDQLAESYGGLSRSLSNLDPNYLTLANKIYVSDKFHLLDTFADTARRDYNSEVDTVDFNEKKIAAASINEWASRKSQGHIQNPVTEDTIDEAAAVALFNIIFFQGKWGVPFKPENTKDEDFYLLDRTVVKKPMMNLVSSLFYYEDEQLGAKLIELPYKEDGYRMVVVLPNEVDGLTTLLEKSQAGLMPSVFKLAPAGFEIDLHMPKLHIETSMDLNDVLAQMGLRSLFTGKASGITKESPVSVTKVFQKAFIDANEEGSTAGAFTGLVAVPLSSNYKKPPPIEVRVDHPFLFLILHEDKTLFLGSCVH